MATALSEHRLSQDPAHVLLVKPVSTIPQRVLCVATVMQVCHLQRDHLFAPNAPSVSSIQQLAGFVLAVPVERRLWLLCH